MRRTVVLVSCVLALGFAVQRAPAQEFPAALSEGGTEWQMKQRKNTWTVGIVGGLLSGTYMRFADEMAKALDDGDDMRVLPIVSYGAASNIDDLLYLRGVDAAITQSDAFEFFRTVRKTANLENRVNYIVRLPLAEVHVLARKEVRSIADLKGKKVSFGPAGAGSSLTGTIVFHRLGMKVEPLYLNPPQSLAKLRSGEIDAMVRVIGKPIDFFARIPADAGLHLVPIPFSKTFADYYSLGEFTAKEYPTLVPEGGRTDTIGVPTVLAAFNWPKGGDRYRRVERFVERLFAKWETLQKPPYHPKWRDVNLTATVPGWKRLPVAEEFLKKAATGEAAAPNQLKQEFQTFLAQDGARAPRNAAEREALFRDFMQWRERQASRTQ